MVCIVKRIVHYSLLALVLLGVPFLCCVIGGYDGILEGVKDFPPRTEDWGLKPELLWNHRCPFNTAVFIGMVLFTALCLFPFVRRGSINFAGGQYVLFEVLAQLWSSRAR